MWSFKDTAIGLESESRLQFDLSNVSDDSLIGESVHAKSRNSYLLCRRKELEEFGWFEVLCLFASDIWVAIELQLAWA